MTREFFGYQISGFKTEKDPGVNQKRAYPSFNVKSNRFCPTFIQNVRHFNPAMETNISKTKKDLNNS